MTNIHLVLHWLLLPCTAPPHLRPLFKKYQALLYQRHSTSAILLISELLREDEILPFLASGRNATSPSTES